MALNRQRLGVVWLNAQGLRHQPKRLLCALLTLRNHGHEHECLKVLRVRRDCRCATLMG